MALQDDLFTTREALRFAEKKVNDAFFLAAVSDPNGKEANAKIYEAAVAAIADAKVAVGMVSAPLNSADTEAKDLQAGTKTGLVAKVLSFFGA